MDGLYILDALPSSSPTQLGCSPKHTWETTRDTFWLGYIPYIPLLSTIRASSSYTLARIDIHSGWCPRYPVASPPRKRWCFWNPNYPKILFFDTEIFTTLIVCWNVKQLWRSAEVLSISFQTPQRSAFDVLDVKTLRLIDGFQTEVVHGSTPWK